VNSDKGSFQYLIRALKKIGLMLEEDNDGYFRVALGEMDGCADIIIGRPPNKTNDDDFIKITVNSERDQQKLSFNVLVQENTCEIDSGPAVVHIKDTKHDILLLQVHVDKKDESVSLSLPPHPDRHVMLDLSLPIALAPDM
jgi:hypothetical protein